MPLCYPSVRSNSLRTNFGYFFSQQNYYKIINLPTKNYIKNKLKRKKRFELLLRQPEHEKRQVGNSRWEADDKETHIDIHSTMDGSAALFIQFMRVVEPFPQSLRQSVISVPVQTLFFFLLLFIYLYNFFRINFIYLFITLISRGARG